MNNRDSLFEAIRNAAAIRREQAGTGCPDSETLKSFSTDLPDDLAVHLAFCPACRKQIQILNTGHAHSETIPNPNWNRMLRRLDRAAHWTVLTDWICSVTGIPDMLRPETLPAVARLAEHEAPETKLTVFEINLTSFPNLSSTRLEVTRFGDIDGSGTTRLIISGFRPELVNASVRMGLARSHSYLDLCGYRKDTRDWDLHRIENRLQKAFLLKGQRSRPLQRLIGESAWLDGRITTGPAGIQLTLTPPESLAGLFLRKDIWAMLLVSNSAMNTECTPEERI
jgi:hypothetical protein